MPCASPSSSSGEKGSSTAARRLRQLGLASSSPPSATDELDEVETDGHLWYIRYPFTDGKGHVTVATTRPRRCSATRASP